MTWLNDLFLFLAVPGIVIVAMILTHRGAAQRYKIVKETNTLGEERYEVWFEHYSLHGSKTWLHKETFDTIELADQYIARQFTTRETVREGKLP